MGAFDAFIASVFRRLGGLLLELGTLPAPPIPTHSVLPAGAAMLRFAKLPALPDESYRYRFIVVDSGNTQTADDFKGGDVAEIPLVATGEGTVTVVIVDGGGNAISYPATRAFKVLPAPDIPAHSVVADPPKPVPPQAGVAL